MRKTQLKVFVVVVWLPEGYREQRQEELQETLDFLASKYWLTTRMTSQQKKIYGLNKCFLEQIKHYLKDVVSEQ